MQDKKAQVDFDFWDRFCLCRLVGSRRSVVYIHGSVDNHSRWEPEQQRLLDGRVWNAVQKGTEDSTTTKETHLGDI